ncbi:hypothetical protein FGO68_gene8401 [Halteria grandinella]|uniref:Uncharacterized protein n=1 Tax=Halteria grandinella TaxID=5974 RepID=A0A8J8T004_HALGN|nr:hypothetical protein FGO68_gene8401 [Halteria grandinella]
MNPFTLSIETLNPRCSFLQSPNIWLFHLQQYVQLSKACSLVQFPHFYFFPVLAFSPFIQVHQMSLRLYRQVTQKHYRIPAFSREVSQFHLISSECKRFGLKGLISIYCLPCGFGLVASSPKCNCRQQAQELMSEFHSSSLLGSGKSCALWIIFILHHLVRIPFALPSLALNALYPLFLPQ